MSSKACSAPWRTIPNVNRDKPLDFQGFVRMPDHSNVEGFECKMLLLHGKMSLDSACATTPRSGEHTRQYCSSLPPPGCPEIPTGPHPHAADAAQMSRPCPLGECVG